MIGQEARRRRKNENRIKEKEIDKNRFYTDDGADINIID